MLTNREAMLRAADFIEHQPERFHFMAVSVPRNRREWTVRACALGWIGHFMLEDEGPLERPVYLDDVADTLGYSTQWCFYLCMDVAAGDPTWRLRGDDVRRGDAALCARALRKLAKAA